MTETKENIYSDFAYDDAFRTAESECDDILIPFVNYFHNEDYDASAKVIRGRNEHFIEHSDHSEDKRITDSSFEIEYCGGRRKYHYECESGRYQDSLLVRMFEYDAQIALDSAGMEKRLLKVEFPYSGILLLRGKGNFDTADVEIITPGGMIKYPVMVGRMSDLELEEIFDRHLYLLLPFYIFNLEGSLEKIDDDPGELERFSDVYRDIIARLEEDTEKGCLSSFSCSVIISLIHKVAYKITMKQKNVQGRVGDIMGGKVMDLEVIRAHREGMADGITVGEARGIENSIKKLAESYMEKDSSLSADKAMEMARKILE